jgi:aryl-alcohol dehydrogenase-like predicted oxidoreductase
VALAWLLRRRPWIVPIPGTKRVAYVEDNAGAPGLELSEADEARLEPLATRVSGERYSAEQQTAVRLSPPPAS